jgi:co-chaperonin GroES (HSP10)|tara:strand:+ start:228 stop:488 length:261 start_codon:yes stop_codon:yes gene_type:complete
MKAIGRYIIVTPLNRGTEKTKGGLFLTETNREDVRYAQAEVVYIGEQVNGLSPKNIIYYDKTAGHKIEIDKIPYHVITLQDVVVVL